MPPQKLFPSSFFQLVVFLRGVELHWVNFVSRGTNSSDLWFPGVGPFSHWKSELLERDESGLWGTWQSVCEGGRQQTMTSLGKVVQSSMQCVVLTSVVLKGSKHIRIQISGNLEAARSPKIPLKHVSGTLLLGASLFGRANGRPGGFAGI